jgi:hypothetical protein
MNSKKLFAVITLASVFLTAACWLYVRATRYVIISQVTYKSTSPGEKASRGHAVRSASDLKAILQEHGIAESDFNAEQGVVNFDREFVFVVENGSLLEINHGFSGFAIAAIKPITNLSIAIVRGAKTRSFKAVTCAVRAGPRSFPLRNPSSKSGPCWG